MNRRGMGMPTKGRMFAGCTVALVTPFRDGRVDETALRALVEWHVAAGDADDQSGRDDGRGADALP